MTHRCAACDGPLPRSAPNPTHCGYCLTIFRAAVYEFAQAYVAQIKGAV